MSVRAIASAGLDVTETLAAASSPASSVDGVSNTRRYNAYNQLNKTLQSSTTPVADTVVDMSFTLAGASTTIDLTAVPSAADVDVDVDLTGKKLVALLISADADNAAGGVTMESGAANGYDFLGDAAYGLTLYPGMTVNLFQLGAAAGLPAVAAGDKTIDFAGTAGDVIECLAVFGTQA